MQFAAETCSGHIKMHKISFKRIRNSFMGRFSDPIRNWSSVELDIRTEPTGAKIECTSATSRDIVLIIFDLNIYAIHRLARVSAPHSAFFSTRMTTAHASSKLRLELWRVEVRFPSRLASDRDRWQQYKHIYTLFVPYIYIYIYIKIHCI